MFEEQTNLDQLLSPVTDAEELSDEIELEEVVFESPEPILSM